MTKIDLRDTTFIIPVSIESSDRLRNFHCCIEYLIHYFDTNIIIAEQSKSPMVPMALDKFENEKCIEVLYYQVPQHQMSFSFHRTFLLNEMLQKVKTKVVANYDVDVILPVESYVKAQEMCLNGFDLVYPYQDALDGQVMAEMDYKCFLEFIDNPTVDLLKGQTWNAKYGFCQFFNTESYKAGYMENENFVSYGPEDVERYERWVKLGYNVGRVENKIYHIEHSRTANSSGANPMFRHNNELYEQLKSFTKEQTIEYYENQNYVKSRR